jgi:Kef-type K+ transport system membrane component KefB
MPNSEKPQRRGLFLFGYLLYLALSALAFYWIQHEGHLLSMSLPSFSSSIGGAAHEQINHLLQVLLALAVVIITAQITGAIFQFLGQPLVIGEVVGGILLGPSFLGAYAPQIQKSLIPDQTLPFLGIIAQLGVVFYMFVVGLELDLKVLKKSGHSALAIAHAGIFIPLVLGAYFALHTFKDLSLPGVPFLHFALFMGISLSITAFPVLARILSAKKLSKTRIGTMALTSAAIGDVTAWCLLALMVSLTQDSFGSVIRTTAFTVLYIGAMFFLGAPLMRRLIPVFEKFDRITEGGIAAFFVALLLSALATELIGIHAIFGAFLLGAITPHDSRMAKELTDKVEALVRIVFLPAFFAFTGMRTQIGLLGSSEDWNYCLIIIGIATLAKFGSTLVSAKLNGFTWKESSALGILMNTRGLVELIVLNLGLDLKLISPRLFTMLVVMALVTTLITSPLLSLLKIKPQSEN